MKQVSITLSRDLQDKFESLYPEDESNRIKLAATILLADKCADGEYGATGEEAWKSAVEEAIQTRESNKKGVPRPSV